MRPASAVATSGASVVGELELAYEVMELPADSGLTISVYSAEPGSRSQQALDLLASWTAAPDQQPAPEADSAPSAPRPPISDPSHAAPTPPRSRAAVRVRGERTGRRPSSPLLGGDRRGAPNQQILQRTVTAGDPFLAARGGAGQHRARA